MAASYTFLIKRIQDCLKQQQKAFEAFEGLIDPS